jgi:thiol-disulfide isomerase/thioredoxin
MTMRRARLFTALALLIAFAGGCGGGETAPPDAASAPATTTAQPGISGSSAGTAPVSDQLRFTAKTVDGQDFDGSSLAGRPAVLWFWAPWCPRCQGEADHVARIARDSGDRVTFVGVAARDEVPAMQRFVDKYRVEFTHLADTDASLWRRFGVTVQPAYAFIDSTGRVDVVKTPLTENDLTGRVTALT